MISSGQTNNQIPPKTIANGVKTTARQSNDHKALNDGHGVLFCLVDDGIITSLLSAKFPFFATVVPVS